MADPFELRRIVDDLCRKDFFAFAIRAFPILEPGKLYVAPHIAIICFLLMKVFKGDVRQALVCIPPRYLKTYLISIAYTAWLLGRDPTMRIICASYGTDLAEKFSADTLKLMRSAWYRRVFPNTHLDPKQQNKTEIGTTVGGYRFATSTGATLTGRGADVIIIDDAIKASEGHSPTARVKCVEWFRSTIHTRFNHPKKGRMIVVAQRLHQEDLPGHIMQTGGWEELILPAIQPTTKEYDIVEGGLKALFKAGRVLQPERHNLSDLEEQKKKMGEFDFEAQFNQCPLPPGGAIIKEQWVKRYETPPKPSQTIAIVQSWDTAYEGDEGSAWSACTSWAMCPDGFYLLDVWRKRPSFPDLVKAVYKLKATRKAKLVIVEKKASGISLIETIRDLDGQQWLVSLTPSKGKVERTEQQAVKFEQGKIWLPQEAPWLAAYEAELFSFPYCEFKDQVDSTVQFLAATDYHQFNMLLKHL